MSTDRASTFRKLSAGFFLLVGFVSLAWAAAMTNAFVAPILTDAGHYKVIPAFTTVVLNSISVFPIALLVVAVLGTATVVFVRRLVKDAEYQFAAYCFVGLLMANVAVCAMLALAIGLVILPEVANAPTSRP